MLNLNNVYNHYSTHLVLPKRNSKFDSHHKNDLKNVYHKMVKDNQSSPFYKFTLSDITQAYTIGIKETALALEANSKALNGDSQNTSGDFKAVSDNKNVITANLTSDQPTDLPKEISIKINSIATGQTNVGTFLPSNTNSFKPGASSLGISIAKNHYTFNINIEKEDTNLTIQRKIAKSINDNRIGIQANIRKNPNNQTSALVLRSNDIGISGNKEHIFQFDERFLENDITEQLGIYHIDIFPSNAEIIINDHTHTTSSNRISLNHSLDIDLLTTSDKPIKVTLQPDDHKVTQKLNNFIISYNQLIDLAKNGSNERGSSKLFKEISNISKRNQEALTNLGFIINEEDHLVLTKEPSSTQIYSLFDEELSSFRKDIKRATDKMTLNPLNYIDKIVVTYPNIEKTYPNPYHPSKYSGLLYNDYA